MPIRPITALALLAAVLIPDRAVHDGPILCGFRRLTGRPCPSCGLTRSWQAAGHGRMREAVAYHPLGPLTMAAAAWLTLDAAAEPRLARLPPRARDAVVLGWLATWMWRLSRR